MCKYDDEKTKIITLKRKTKSSYVLFQAMYKNRYYTDILLKEFRLGHV